MGHRCARFLDDLKERMRKFELALHPDKTRLIRFGRHAACPAIPAWIGKEAGMLP
jgi:hypothetical protein